MTRLHEIRHYILNDGRYIYFPDSNHVVNYGIKDLFLENFQRRKIKVEDASLNEEIIETKLRDINQVIFETTQVCPLKCLYCTYSDFYPYKRQTSSRTLSFDTAKKTLDYILGITGKRAKKELTIGFYGGEPLANFGVLKEITEYSKQIFKGWQLHFTITTNGVLMDEPVTRFLIENDFSLMVSLDGNEENHDSKRVFPDGSGSFPIIMDNVQKIREINEPYYLDRVMFFITYSRDLSLDSLYRFFLTDERVNKNSVRFSPVNFLNTDYYEKYPYDKPGYNRQMNAILETIAEKKINKLPLAPIEHELFTKVTEFYGKLQGKRLSVLAGTCIFNNRLYIDSDGRFHVCEKMNDRFPIGDCNKGFDLPAMRDMVQAFMNLVRQKCGDCDARFLCNRCFIHFAADGKFEINPEFCEINKRSIKKLENIIRLKEKGVF
jgi:uncharacterized protein